MQVPAGTIFAPPPIPTAGMVSGSFVQPTEPVTCNPDTGGPGSLMKIRAPFACKSGGFRIRIVTSKHIGVFELFLTKTPPDGPEEEITDRLAIVGGVHDYADGELAEMPPNDSFPHCEAGDLIQLMCAYTGMEELPSFQLLYCPLVAV